jgi:hypothetical protein
MPKYRPGHRPCGCCRHPERARIELLHAGGASFNSLADKFGLPPITIRRHWDHHVTDEAKATYLAGPGALEELAARAAEAGDSVLDYLKLVRTVLTAQLTAMAEAGDGRGAALVAGQLTRTCEAIARVTGELSDLARSTTYNITNNIALLAESPAFMQVQATLLRALAPYPEARTAVVNALRELDETTPATKPMAAQALPPRIIDNDEN